MNRLALCRCLAAAIFACLLIGAPIVVAIANGLTVLPFLGIVACVLGPPALGVVGMRLWCAGHELEHWCR